MFESLNTVFHNWHLIFKEAFKGKQTLWWDMKVTQANYKIFCLCSSAKAGSKMLSSTSSFLSPGWVLWCYRHHSGGAAGGGQQWVADGTPLAPGGRWHPSDPTAPPAPHHQLPAPHLPLLHRFLWQDHHVQTWYLGEETMIEICVSVMPWRLD